MKTVQSADRSNLSVSVKTEPWNIGAHLLLQRANQIILFLFAEHNLAPSAAFELENKFRFLSGKILTDFF